MTTIDTPDGEGPGASYDPWVRISLIEHHLYCPRQAMLIVREDWSDNEHTVHGGVVHARVDGHGVDGRRGVRAHHAVALRHDALRLHGVADTVEEHPDGALVPVEHKSGRLPKDPAPAVLQATAQALCLAAMTGRPVHDAAVYYAAENRRLRISVDQHAWLLLAVLDEIRANLTAPHLPAWASRSALCRRCSLRPACLPELKEAS